MVKGGAGGIQKGRAERWCKGPSGSSGPGTGVVGRQCPYECTIAPGDILYFPMKWYHSTLNLDPHTTFMSTFTDEQELLM